MKRVVLGRFPTHLLVSKFLSLISVFFSLCLCLRWLLEIALSYHLAFLGHDTSALKTPYFMQVVVRLL